MAKYLAQRVLLAGRRGLVPDPRRLRLLQGVRDRAALPRGADAADRRGHRRHPADDHRPPAARGVPAQGLTHGRRHASRDAHGEHRVTEVSSRAVQQERDERPAGAPRIRDLSLEYPMSLGVFEKYEEAQRAVDYLSDKQFPVQNCMIVGTDLQADGAGHRTADLRHGRDGRRPPSGRRGSACSSASCSASSPTPRTTRSAADRQPALLGRSSSASSGRSPGYAATGGRRDFTSVSQVVATRYEVLVEHKLAEKARQILQRMRHRPPAAALSLPRPPTAPRRRPVRGLRPRPRAQRPAASGVLGRRPGRVCLGGGHPQQVGPPQATTGSRRRASSMPSAAGRHARRRRQHHGPRPGGRRRRPGRNERPAALHRRPSRPAGVRPACSAALADDRPDAPRPPQGIDGNARSRAGRRPASLVVMRLRRRLTVTARAGHRTDRLDRRTVASARRRSALGGRIAWSPHRRPGPAWPAPQAGDETAYARRADVRRRGRSGSAAMADANACCPGDHGDFVPVRPVGVRRQLLAGPAGPRACERLGRRGGRLRRRPAAVPRRASPRAASCRVAVDATLRATAAGRAAVRRGRRRPAVLTPGRPGGRARGRAARATVASASCVAYTVRHRTCGRRRRPRVRSRRCAAGRRVAPTPARRPTLVEQRSAPIRGPDQRFGRLGRLCAERGVVPRQPQRAASTAVPRASLTRHRRTSGH